MFSTSVQIVPVRTWTIGEFNTQKYSLSTLFRLSQWLEQMSGWIERKKILSFSFWLLITLFRMSLCGLEQIGEFNTQKCSFSTFKTRVSGTFEKHFWYSKKLWTFCLFLVFSSVHLVEKNLSNSMVHFFSKPTFQRKKKSFCGLLGWEKTFQNLTKKIMQENFYLTYGSIFLCAIFNSKEEEEFFKDSGTPLKYVLKFLFSVSQAREVWKMRFGP